jgi:hypothetical protein
MFTAIRIATGPRLTGRGLFVLAPITCRFWNRGCADTTLAFPNDCPLEGRTTQSAAFLFAPWN